MVDNLSNTQASRYLGRMSDNGNLMLLLVIYKNFRRKVLIYGTDAVAEYYILPVLGT